MKVLIACEFSGIVREAFRKKGHDAWSCDLLPTEIPGQHIQYDAGAVIWEDWDLIIAHPPCTYLANSGVRWLFDAKGYKILDRWDKLAYAISFFNTIKDMADYDKTRVCIENPIPHKYARDGFIHPTNAEILDGIGDYTQIIHPWQFGHGETKATCLWLQRLPKLQPTNIVDGRVPRVHHESPGPDRWKNRSRTFHGIANAMAEQWG